MKKILPFFLALLSLFASAQIPLDAIHSIRELNAQMIEQQKNRQQQKLSGSAFYEPDTVRYYTEELGNIISVWKYNAAGLPILKEDFGWDDAWIPIIKYDFEYDENGNQTLLLATMYDFGVWTFYSKVVNEYDQNNKQTYEIAQFYLSTESIWVDMYDTRNTYDPTTHLKTLVIERGYNTETEAWENAAKHLYTYNADGLVTEWKRQIWGETDWVESQKYTSVYETKNRISYTESSWTGTEWKDEFRYVSKYNKNLKIEDINQSYGEGKWDTNIVYHYSYNAEGDLLSELMLNPVEGKLDSNQILENTYSEKGDLVESLYFLWLYEEGKQPQRKLYYVYDEHHNTIEAGARFYQHGEWLKEDNYLSLYYNDRKSEKFLFANTLTASYIDVTKLSNEKTSPLDSDFQCTLFPNPAGDYLRWEIKNLFFKRAKAEILDMQGRVLHAEYFSGNALNLRTATLPQGVYLLIVQEGTLRFVKNFIKR